MVSVWLPEIIFCGLVPLVCGLSLIPVVGVISQLFLGPLVEQMLSLPCSSFTEFCKCSLKTWSGGRA